MKLNTLIWIIQLFLVGLKLCNCIDWSWFVVLTPVWISFILAIITFRK